MAPKAQWYMAAASRLLQACLRMTMQLLPDLLVTGATRSNCARRHNRAAAWAPSDAPSHISDRSSAGTIDHKIKR